MKNHREKAMLIFSNLLTSPENWGIGNLDRIGEQEAFTP